VLAASDREAARKEAVICPLAAATKLGRAAVQAAAQNLGLGAPRVYALVRAFRGRSATTLLQAPPPGQSVGARRLDPTVDALVEEATKVGGAGSSSRHCRAAAWRGPAGLPVSAVCIVIKGILIVIKGRFYRDEGRKSEPGRANGAELS
jgi:hypothetical protein